MEKETKKINFFKDVFKSIKDLDKYEDFALEQPGKAFKYFVKMILIFGIIISFFYTYKITNNINDIYENLKDKLPNFSYSQGNLKVDINEPIIIDDYKDTFGKIIIDTNINENEIDKYKRDIKNNNLITLFLKDKCIVLSNNSMGQVTYKYSDITKNYNINDFTKQDLVNYINGMSQITLYFSIYLVIFVYLFIMYFISILLDVLMLSLLALIVSRLSRIKLKFAPSFSIAIHAITLPIILNLIYIIVNLLTGFNIRYFQLMYNTISYIYVIVAILMIKTDFINRQIELIKISKEQEKIKEEIKNKEQEEERKKRENKEPKEEKPETNDTNKRKKKEKKEEKGIGADSPAYEETPEQ